MTKVDIKEEEKAYWEEREGQRPSWQAPGSPKGSQTLRRNKKVVGRRPPEPSRILNQG